MQAGCVVHWQQGNMRYALFKQRHLLTSGVCLHQKGAHAAQQDQLPSHVSSGVHGW